MLRAPHEVIHTIRMPQICSEQQDIKCRAAVYQRLTEIREFLLTDDELKIILENEYVRPSPLLRSVQSHTMGVRASNVSVGSGIQAGYALAAETHSCEFSFHRRLAIRPLCQINVQYVI